jgi:hypothetical protein
LQQESKNKSPVIKLVYFVTNLEVFHQTNEMIKYSVILAFSLLFGNLCQASNNSAKPSTPNLITVSDKDPIPKIAKLKIKEVEKLIGRKLTLKEKISFKLVQWKLKKKSFNVRKEGSSKTGDLAMILGIAGLVSLFIPYVMLLAIPCAILAIIFGYSARKKNPGDTHAKVGIILGWVTVGVFIVALIIAIAVLSSIGWY